MVECIRGLEYGYERTSAEGNGYGLDGGPGRKDQGNFELAFAS